MCHSANAAATPRSPSAASARTPPLALVARSLAMERPPLGLGPRALEVVRYVLRRLWIDNSTDVLQAAGGS
jgi:hypothetical protein